MKLSKFIVFCGLTMVLAGCVSAKTQIEVSEIYTTPETDFYTADIKIPVFLGEDSLNNLISTQMDVWFLNFQDEITWQLDSPLFQNQDFKCAFYGNWQLEQNSPEYISVLLSAYSFTGGANGLDQLASFTWNKKSDRLVTLQDLVPMVANPPSLEVLSNLCQKQLNQILDAENDSDLQEMIALGTEPLQENFQVFTLSEKGATIYFTKYQVAPGSFGIQKVFLPFVK